MLERKRKLLAVVLSIAIILSLSSIFKIKTFAQTASGICGECTWSIDGTVLTISGNGYMGSFKNESPGWNGFEITEVIVEEGVKSIGAYAFAGDNIKKISLPDTVESIGEYAFSYCDFTYIDLPESLAYIGNNAFLSCHNLLTIKIPDGIEVIKSSTFTLCSSLTFVELAESIIRIEEYAFHACEKLSRLEIEGNVQAIERSAFQGCTALENIYIKGIEGYVIYTAFANSNNIKNVYYGNDEEHWNNAYFTWGTHEVETRFETAEMHFNSSGIPQDITTVEDYSFPEKRIYQKGLVKLDLSGGKLKVTYSDNSIEIIDMTLSMVNNEISRLYAGVEWVTIKCKNYYTSYRIEILGENHICEFENGLCKGCGTKTAVISNATALEPTIFHKDEFIYGAYSQTFENASKLILDFKPFGYGEFDHMYIYRKDYDLEESFGYELNKKTAEVKGDTVILRLVSPNSSMKYNANVTICYDFPDGDINGDTVNNAEDLICFRKFLTGSIQLFEYQRLYGDINYDGECDLKDFVSLKKLLVEMD